MTDLADLAIDLEAALELCAVVFAERPREGPLVLRRRCVVFLRQRGAASERDGGGIAANNGVPQALLRESTFRIG